MPGHSPINDNCLRAHRPPNLNSDENYRMGHQRGALLSQQGMRRACHGARRNVSDLDQLALVIFLRVMQWRERSFGENWIVRVIQVLQSPFGKPSGRNFTAPILI
jgi:hypothetical protein